MQHVCESEDREEVVVCELCEASVASFNQHMKRNHPGCGRSANRQGYRSNGSYVDGWFGGECGSGNPYYLLCGSCREKYLALKSKNKASASERYWTGGGRAVGWPAHTPLSIPPPSSRQPLHGPLGGSGAEGFAPFPTGNANIGGVFRLPKASLASLLSFVVKSHLEVALGFEGQQPNLEALWGSREGAGWL